MGYWRDPVRKDWKYQFQHQGKFYSGRGLATKAAARIARAEHQKAVREESTRQTAGMDFKDAAYAYLDDSRRRHVKKTHQGKVYAIKLFYKHLQKQNSGNIPLSHVTPQVLNTYLQSRPSNNNYNVHRKELHALFTYCRRTLRVIDFNPLWDVAKMPHTPERKRIPTEAQVLELIMAAYPETERPFLLTVLFTLARVDEIYRLTWQDVNFKTKTLTLWTRKRKGGSYEADPMPINADLYDVLWRLWKTKGQNQWVFISQKTGTRYKRRQDFMKKICKRAGIEPHFGFHALRHFMASYLADKKKRSTKTLQRLLRHKEVRTTEIYLHSVDESIREAMDSIEGDFLNGRIHKSYIPKG